MPMVTIVDADDLDNPTSGKIHIEPDLRVPVMKSLEQWWPGSWLEEDAAWRPDIGSPEGVGGTPAPNAGAGALFNNQYGFMFMGVPMMGTAKMPTGKSLAIRLDSLSSPLLEAFNYVNASNLWDQIWTTEGDQVVWNGTMWHNYFTLPSDAPNGIYEATFEIFIVDYAFTSGTGFADYTLEALTAERNTNFESAFVTYQFEVAQAIPEPSTWMLLGMVAVGIWGCRRCRIGQQV